MAIAIISLNANGLHTENRVSNNLVWLNSLNFDFGFIQETNLCSPSDSWKIKELWSERVIFSLERKNSKGVATLVSKKYKSCSVG